MFIELQKKEKRTNVRKQNTSFDNREVNVSVVGKQEKY